MTILTLKDYIAEARKAEVKYTESKTKGVIDKVIAELQGSDAAQMTKLARRLKNVKLAIKRLGESEKELTAQAHELGNTFFEPAEIWMTRTLETAKFTLSIAKQQEAKEKTDVDYEKIVEGLMALIDKELLPKAEELITANTRKYTTAAPKPAILVKQLEEGVVDAAKGALGAMLSRIQAYAVKLKVKFRAWGERYDAKLQELKDELKAMETVSLGESAEELYVVIGNPGRGQPSALWPETEKPEAMSRLAAEEQAEKINAGRSKITYGVLPSSVHWHAKPLSKALDYVIGPKAAKALKDLKKAQA